MIRFDAYEIHPVAVVGHEGGIEIVEPVHDDVTKPDFWSLYGHVPGMGLECIGDFASFEAAAAVYARITGHPYGDEPLANAARAARGEAALAAASGGAGPEALTDQLADLQHWCAEHQVDWNAALRLAEMHYEAERGDNFDI